MNVNIKKMSVEIPVKNSGIEFEVRSTDDQFIGDCVITKTGLTWCEGRTRIQNGKKISWDEFRTYMNRRT